MKRILGLIVASLLTFVPAAKAQVLGGGGNGALPIGTPITNGISGDCLYVTSAIQLGQQSCGSATITIGSTITSSTAGYGLYVGTGGSAGLLEQFAYGTNVFTALQSTLNGSGAISATTAPQFVTPFIDAATGTSLTLGTQSTTRGTLVLANTNAGAYPTTIQSSNSATAAATYTLPPAIATGAGYVLTDAAANGVLSWAASGGGSSTLTVGTTATSGGAAGQLMYDTGSVLTESANLLVAANGAASTPELALKGTWFSGGSATTTKPALLIEPTGTTSAGWSTSGTGLGVNSAGAFAGNLLDLQVGGASQFEVNVNGNVNMGAAAALRIGMFNGNTLYVAPSATINISAEIGAVGVLISSANPIGFASTTTLNGANAPDTMFTRHAAANMQLGAADAAAPVAQTLGAQSVVAGTSNTAGALWSLYDSAGTGSGASGGFSWFTHPAGAAATVQNTAVLEMNLSPAGVLNVVGGYSANGSAGVSCTVGTINPVTAVVTNGIITHC